VYVSGNEAAISGDTRSEEKSPLSSLTAGGTDTVEIEAVDFEGLCSAEGEVSRAMISDMVGIVESVRMVVGRLGLGIGNLFSQCDRGLGLVAILRQHGAIETQGIVLLDFAVCRCNR